MSRDFPVETQPTLQTAPSCCSGCLKRDEVIARVADELEMAANNINRAFEQDDSSNPRWVHDYKLSVRRLAEHIAAKLRMAI